MPSYFTWLAHLPAWLSASLGQQAAQVSLTNGLIIYRVACTGPLWACSTPVANRWGRQGGAIVKYHSQLSVVVVLVVVGQD